MGDRSVCRWYQRNQRINILVEMAAGQSGEYITQVGIGFERGGQRAAAMYTLIGTAKLNDVDPQAWLADVIARISDMPVSRLHELLPWHWNEGKSQVKAA